MTAESLPYGRPSKRPHARALYEARLRALEAIFDPAFDPHRTAVVPGDGPVRGAESASGSARLIANAAEEVVVDCDSGAAGVLFLRRAYLSLWRVSIDGQAASTLIAQVARLGVAVPAGRHRVRFWIDRRPLAGGLALAVGGIVLLAFLLRRPARPGARPAGVGERFAG